MKTRPGHVVVVGSVNRNISVRVDQFPAPGETRSGTTLVQTLRGKGANQAVAAPRAGSEVSFLAAVGADETGVQPRKELSGHGLTTDRVRTVPGSSGTACITVDDKGQNCIVVGGTDQTWNSLDLADELLIRGGDVLLVQLENDLELVMKAAEMARSASVPVVFNPATMRKVPPRLLECVDVLVLNASGPAQSARSGFHAGASTVRQGSLCGRLYARRRDRVGGRVSRVADELGPARQSIRGQLHAP